MNGRSGIGVWLILGGCAVLIVAAMGWLTRSVMQAEADRSLAESKARLEEKIRLSLWRMDSLAATVTIEENQRVLLPEQETDGNTLAKLRFQLCSDGSSMAIGEQNGVELEELQGLLKEQSDDPGFSQLSTAIQFNNQWAANQDLEQGQTIQQEKKKPDPVQQRAAQQALSQNERAQRGKVINYAVSKAGLSQQMEAQDTQAALQVSSGGFNPTWLANEAFLLRQVPGGSVIEGVWLDQESFRRMLLAEIVDLLPSADLEPSDAEGEASAMDLASFPWRLVPGEEAVASPELRGPVVASLSVGWLAVLVALLAGLALIRGIMRLSERRASFVSAVTHELRTPLTTFRLYSDMLASGAVGDEGKRAGYFRTMRREADRLSHLVENVLAFSRIERKGEATRTANLEIKGLLESMRERFDERLVGAGLKLEMEVSGEPVARGDAAAVEHVLFNLVDNAAKYAAGSDPAVVTLTGRQSGGGIEIEVADHGPGIPEGERQRIFRAFHKSAAEAADSKPGVGLGLALSLRIARDMGGELECRDGQGARFVLVLPSA